MVDAKTLGILTSLAVGLGVLALCLLLFEVLRHALPSIFYYRNEAAAYPEYNSPTGEPLGTAPFPGAFWPATVVPYRHETLCGTHGVDTALFLRYLQTQALTFVLIAVIGLVVLMPTYASGTNRDLPVGSSERTVGVDIVSLANLPSRDNRLWVVLVADAVVVAVILFMQRRDLVYYTAVRRAHRLASSPENFTLLLMDLPRDLRDDAALFRFFDDRLFPEQVAAAHVVRDAASLLKLRNRYVAAYTQREAALIADEAAEKDGAPQMVKVRGDRVPAAVHYAEVEEAVFGEAADARGRLDETAPITAAAFVTFRTRHTAAAAAGVPMMLGVKVMRAPEPRAVLWDRLHVTKKTAAIRKTVVTTLVLVMALFWFVPISAIALLSNLEELGKQNGLEWIANFRQDVPWLAKLVEGFLPPILLLVLNVLVPVFIRLILTRARYPSRALLDCAVLRHHYLFLVLTTFIVSATAGSLLSAIDTIVNNPSVSELVDILSKTIPSQASFFIALSLLQLLLAAATSCLCLGKLLLRPILMAGSGRSERLRRKKSDALSAYPFFKLYAVIGLHGLIATVYSTVAPLCALFVGLSLFLLYCTTKHMAMYSQRSMFEGNGVIFKTAWEHSFVALVLHQVILIGLFGLKKAPILAGLEVALLIFTVLFFGKCRRKYYRIAEVGAMADISVTPNESEGVPPRFDDLYVHPGLQEIADIPVVATQ